MKYKQTARHTVFTFTPIQLNAMTMIQAAQYFMDRSAKEPESRLEANLDEDGEPQLFSVSERPETDQEMSDRHDNELAEHTMREALHKKALDEDRQQYERLKERFENSYRNTF